MNQPVFTYNQEQASQIGGGQYVTKSGGYDFKIVRAQFTSSQNSNAKFLEFDFESRDGLKCNYVSINYQAGNGQPNDFGNRMIQAIMGCTGVNQLTVNQNGGCQELFGKFIKCVVQRVDYTKNNGQDGYKFELKLPANMQTGQTVKEALNNEPAKAFAQYAESIIDKDERVQQSNSGYQQQPQRAGQQSQGGYPTDFEDDGIPFAPVGLQYPQLLTCM